MAPDAIWKFILLFSVMGPPLKKVPAGTSTVSPLAAAFTAACMAATLSALAVDALYGAEVMLIIAAYDAPKKTNIKKNKTAAIFFVKK
jgi:hypothetical protein